jgi:hypothetical protein
MVKTGLFELKSWGNGASPQEKVVWPVLDVNGKGNISC